MRRLRFVLSIVLCLVLANTALAQQGYTNPVINYSVPDPSIIKAQDGYYYLVGTEDTHNVPIYRSHNLVDWQLTWYSQRRMVYRQLLRHQL